MSYIYQYKWVDPFTGWNWLLNIIPAGSTAIDRSVSSNYKEIPFGAITVKKMSKSFDTIRLGLPKTPQLEFEVDLNLLPDKAMQTDYADLYSALKNPLSQQSVLTAPAPLAVSGSTLEIETGTAYELLCDFNGDSTFSGYKHVDSFIQLLAPDDEYDSENNNLKITADWYVRSCYEMLDFHQIVGYATETDHTDDRIVEFMFDDSTNKVLFGHLASAEGESGVFKFTQYKKIWDWYESTIAQIFKKAMRLSTWNTEVLPKPLVKYYKQTYDGSGQYNAIELDMNELYVLAEITKYNDDLIDIRGFISRSELNNSMFRFDNLYDYLDDLYQESLTVASYEYDVPYASAIKGAGFYKVIEREDFESLKIKHNLFSLNKVRSSMNEIIDNDIDYYEKSGAKSRKEGSCTLPFIFSNHPVDTNYIIGNHYKQFKTSFNAISLYNHVKYTIPDSKSGRASKVHTSSLYYLESTSTLINGANLPIPVRVHEHCDVKVAPSVQSYDINENAFNPIDYSSKHASGDLTISEIQSISKPKIISTAMFGSIKRKNPGLEVKLRYNKKTNVSSETDDWWLWNFEKRNFYFNPGVEVDDDYSYLDTDWIMQGVEIDFETGFAEIKLYEADVNAVS